MSKDKCNEYAIKVAKEHISSLNERRKNVITYRQVGENGKLKGRTFAHGGRKYAECIENQIDIEEVQGTGDPTKYYTAIKKLTFPCQNNCNLKCCPWCVYRNRGFQFTDNYKEDLKSILYLSTEKWGKFRTESNFAPTKKILRLLREDDKFMKLLDTKFSYIIPIILPFFGQDFVKNMMTNGSSFDSKKEPNKLTLPYLEEQPNSDSVVYENQLVVGNNNKTNEHVFLLPPINKHDDFIFRKGNLGLFNLQICFYMMVMFLPFYRFFKRTR